MFVGYVHWSNAMLRRQRCRSRPTLQVLTLSPLQRGSSKVLPLEPLFRLLLNYLAPRPSRWSLLPNSSFNLPPTDSHSDVNSPQESLCTDISQTFGASFAWI